MRLADGHRRFNTCIPSIARFSYVDGRRQVREYSTSFGIGSLLSHGTCPVDFRLRYRSSRKLGKPSRIGRHRRRRRQDSIVSLRMSRFYVAIRQADVVAPAMTHHQIASLTGYDMLLSVHSHF